MAYRPNYKGIGELINSPLMVADMHRRAEKVKTAAEAAAPFRAKDPAPHYNEQFIASAKSHGGIHSDRAEGKVENVDEAAFQIEHGTSDTPRHRTLGTALHAARD